jgi:PAT family beta-lactamase induction signal transducer AmpG
VPTPPGPRPAARQDLLGFAAVLAAVAVGYLLSDRFAQPVAQALLGPLLEGSTLEPLLQKRWVDLAALLLGIGFTLPLAAWRHGGRSSRPCWVACRATSRSRARWPSWA